MRPGLGLMAAAVLVLSCAEGSCHKAPASTTAGADDDPRANVARLQRANALLQRQIDLAAGKDFYLVLDPAAGSLVLMLKGARLQQFGVRGLQVGHPRVSWVGLRDRRRIEDVIWSKGELDPPRLLDRLVIQAAPPAKEGAEQTGKEAEPTPPPVPPTPEELYPVPSRYHIRFADGLSMEVRPREADTTVIQNAGGLPLPTELDGRFVDKFLYTEQERDKARKTMQASCRRCHDSSWVDGHWERFMNTIQHTNGATLAATQLMQDIWKRDLAQNHTKGGNPFDEFIEKVWSDVWLFYANTIRFSSAMGGGGDYSVFADGKYHLSRAVREMEDWLKARKTGTEKPPAKKK